MPLGDFDSIEALRDSADVMPAHPDPLREPDVLYEAYPLAIRIDTVRSVASILLDCRFCQPVPGNTAVLSVSTSCSIEWAAPASISSGYFQWTIASWNVDVSSAWMARAELGWSGEGSITMRGRDALFVNGDVPGMDAAQPDFTTDSPRAIRQGLAAWDSPFTPMSFSRFSSNG